MLGLTVLVALLLARCALLLVVLALVVAPLIRGAFLVAKLVGVLLIRGVLTGTLPGRAGIRQWPGPRDGRS